MLELTWLVIVIVLILSGHVLWGLLMIFGLPVLLMLIAVIMVLFGHEGGKDEVR